MSEEKITMVKKEKDPKRVEAGRKLAEYNRTAKRGKVLDLTQPHGESGSEPEDRSEQGGIGIATILTGVGVITGLACLYFTYKQDRRSETRELKDSGDEVHTKDDSDNNNTSQETVSKLRSFNN